jgi:FkbM family methyltransferase
MSTGIVRGLPLNTKLAIAKRLTSPVVGRVLRRVFAGRVPGCGALFDTRVDGFSDTAVASIFFNLYERAERHFVERTLPVDLDVVELGGSLGVVTRTILRKLEPTRRLVTVEADPRLAKGLSTALASFCDSGRLIIENAAVDYDSSAQQTRFSPSESNLGGSLGDTRRSVEVTRTTLSDLLSRHQIDAFSLVCDIEGAEAGLLFQDGEAMARCRNVVIETHAVRYNGKHIMPRDLRERLETLGFQLLGERGPVLAMARRLD